MQRSLQWGDELPAPQAQSFPLGASPLAVLWPNPREGIRHLRETQSLPNAQSDGALNIL